MQSDGTAIPSIEQHKKPCIPPAELDLFPGLMEQVGFGCTGYGASNMVYHNQNLGYPLERFTVLADEFQILSHATAAEDQEIQTQVLLLILVFA